MQDLNDKITGGTLTAAEWNEVPSEIQNVIEGLGITLSSGDLNQLGKAIAGYVGNGTFYTDSGAADAYVLTTIGLKQSLTAYTDGAIFEFIAGNPNTGASTVNVAGLGVKNIKLRDGTDPTIGQIAGRTIVKFDLANDRCELIQSGMINIVTFTAGGTYNPPAGVKGLEFAAVGGGGGGGGADGQGASTSALASGGGAGGYSTAATTSIESAYTITIGAGGTGGAAGNNNGTNGGNTVIASTGVNVTTNGGTGGTGMTGASGNGGVTGGDGGAASGGDINVRGSDAVLTTIVSGQPASAGHSGGGPFGGVIEGRRNGAGGTATAIGTGGSGAGSEDVATNFAGGNGANGIVIIWEFF